MKRKALFSPCSLTRHTGNQCAWSATRRWFSAMHNLKTRLGFAHFDFLNEKINEWTMAWKWSVHFLLSKNQPIILPKKNKRMNFVAVSAMYRCEKWLLKFSDLIEKQMDELLVMFIFICKQHTTRMERKVEIKFVEQSSSSWALGMKNLIDGTSKPDGRWTLKLKCYN